MKTHESRRTALPAVANTVYMEHLTSEECFLPENGDAVRILKDISLSMAPGEAWAVSAGTSVEVRLLLEIMANIRPYAGGRCVLAERGMMRRKRVILNHVFYIGGTDMLYRNMNVLEYLMFSLGRSKTESVLLQEELFEFLIDIGLGYISLTKVSALTPEERAVTALIAALYSDSLLIVFNLPECHFDEVLTGAVGQISQRIRRGGKTLVIGTDDGGLVQEACTHAAFLAGGQLIYKGTAEALRLRYDPVELIVRGSGLALLAAWLKPLLPGFALEIKDEGLLILNRDGIPYHSSFLHEKILETGFIPETIEINPKSVRNAYEELLRRYDLQEKLLQEGAEAGVCRG